MRTRAGSASALAQTYFSLNPGLFTSDESWSYRDLQQLCLSLGINAAGKRGVLEQRLEAAHREGRQGRVCGVGLFHDEEVNVTSPTKRVSPSLLSPLVIGTPLAQSNNAFSGANRMGGASILRRESSYGENGTPTPIRLKKAVSLRFSPFNKVHIIPPKEESENFGHYREPAADAIGAAVWDDDDDDDDAARCRGMDEDSWMADGDGL
ncbi:hypothetical protein KFE25_013818 [Diacronema lutheri]|uniref:SAP domain-containing protein n=1 Tax=Diacronema lutheri TaxID=2081491 RepID=A0A8J5XVL2_DIALT|nr:hypothetical protein KFE25_013818 [Diacronema lutheri]